MSVLPHLWRGHSTWGTPQLYFQLSVTSGQTSSTTLYNKLELLKAEKKNTGNKSTVTSLSRCDFQHKPCTNTLQKLKPSDFRKSCRAMAVVRVQMVQSPWPASKIPTSCSPSTINDKINISAVNKNQSLENRAANNCSPADICNNRYTVKSGWLICH